MLALALVPVLAINLYAGSRIIKLKNVTNEEKEPKSVTTQMVELNDYREISEDSKAESKEGAAYEVQDTNQEESVFEKLQNVYVSSNKEFNEILESEDKASEVYASALYAKLKMAGLSDEIIRKEIDSILAFSLTFTDMGDETWEKLFGNLESTIFEYENVIDYYYPLAIYVHKSECELEHQPHEFDETRMTCARLEEMASQAMCNSSYVDYVKDMIEASGEQNLVNQYQRIVNSSVSFEDVLGELDTMYLLSQTPMCIDEDVWNETFKNLLTTVSEYENVFEIYGDLSYFVHTLNCDFEHYTDECGVHVCEGLRLQYNR